MSVYDKGWKAALGLAADWLEDLFQDMGEDAAELFLKPGIDPNNNVYDQIRILRPDATLEGVSDARIPKSK